MSRELVRWKWVSFNVTSCQPVDTRFADRPAPCHIEGMDITLVRAFRLYQPGAQVSQLWVAALPPEQAIAAVLMELSGGDWRAEVAQPQLSADEIAKLNLRPGEVVDYSRSRQ